ncbi:MULTISPECIES: precorrin-8X methylmutase [Leptolyngbya]|jgi:precorrin-8X/cobalt-precorrin-8 methylmutase|uniref:Precorrin-8X methylmutase n=2 Tax=Leptolyngbya boryana TaxID=1184 RepID=A0A1Z4JMF4_LEPBY|nr:MULTISPECIES: precorrin-8X methylmutase [Leptolyngbya]BAY57921.1 precorrin-8X methylmutase [Leptolyngbya boryana NIES-2135]MBD1854509.1 precorrin-8X methylmutase [Leptolyngbya sp. FACHB-1624]MBD2367366.1 precorrin-8X methylmutase [Leptolyngbya sp. FACHB-161]MBD2373890.1 precorrin-8X methylmutase [Leptolyngbya sp. FACHB-238]MBD2398310.1 precorrin-8X methylmutase [Leptolyngbya sp. FACHB-239]
MEWHPTDAQSLALIDREVGDHMLSPAEYEIVRRVIYATADFDYKSLIHFSDLALQSGAAALAARTTIIVDVPMVQVGINTNIQNTFANPIYCSMEAITRPQKEKTRAAWGIETLARRYPEGIFVVGQSQTALITLAALIQKEEIKPTLVIATPSGFLDIEAAKARLSNALVPNICTQGRKGNAVVAAAIVNSLVDLAWQAYGGDNAV